MAEKQEKLYDRLAPILFIVVIVMSFAIGVLWQKVENLQGGSGTKVAGNTDTGTGTGAVANPLSTDNLKKYAADLKLNKNDFNNCLDSGKFAQAVKDDLSQGEKNGVQGTPAFFINGRFLGGAFPFDSFKEIIDKELNGTGSTDATKYSEYLQTAFNDPRGKAFDPNPKTIELGSTSVRGNKDAKVTMVEFSDFECPFCVRFYSDTYQKLKTEYIDTGKVRFVYKHYPLSSIHPNAQKAAEASLCAGEQNKFWEFHDKLFEVQGTASN